MALILYLFSASGLPGKMLKMLKVCLGLRMKRRLRRGDSLNWHFIHVRGPEAPQVQQQAFVKG